MRKSMKLGAASALAAVALVAGSASAASAGTGHASDDPYVCGNTEAEADRDVTGDGSVPNCQFGDINIFNTNTNENENENESVNVNDNESEAEVETGLEISVDLGGLLGGDPVVPAV
jgi:ABC-type phosphate transport system substrate-binding protein